LEEEVEWWDKTESDWKESAIVFNPPRASAFNFVWSDTLYISGGYYFSPLLTTLKLAPDGTWRNGIDLPQPRAGGATALIGSHAYFIGGETNSGVTSNMDIYNLVSNSILTGTSLLAPRAGHAIASYDEIIYVFGGHGTSSSYILNTVLAFDSRVTGIDDHLPAQNPESIAIVSNYPNPFNGSTNIQFELNKNTLVDLNIFNIQGQKIREIVKGNFAAGKYNFTWNGKSFLGNSVSSGLYILVLQTDNQKIKRKIMYLK